MSRILINSDILLHLFCVNIFHKFPSVNTKLTVYTLALSKIFAFCQRNYFYNMLPSVNRKLKPRPDYVHSPVLSEINKTWIAIFTLENEYVDLVVFTHIAGTSKTGSGRY